MTDQNDRTGADEQAREVEVVLARVARDHMPQAFDCSCGYYPDHDLSGMERDHALADHTAAEQAAALEPVRAAERQEAARVELLTAADELAGRIDRVVDPDEWRRDGYDDGWASAAEAAVKVLRGRADGVTGRSEA